MYAYCSNNPIIFADPSGEGIIEAYIYNAVLLGYIVWVSDSIEGLFETYYELRKLAAGTGFEVHHLIEQRYFQFVNDHGMGFSSKGKMPCVIISKEEHATVTGILRKKAKYGTPPQDMASLGKIYQEVYSRGGGGRDEWMDYIASYFD